MKHKMKDAYCPRCNLLINAASNADTNEKYKPKKGDLSVCINCAQILEFNNDLIPVELTNENFHLLSEEEQKSLQQAVDYVNSRRSN